MNPILITILRFWPSSWKDSAHLKNQILSAQLKIWWAWASVDFCFLNPRFFNCAVLVTKSQFFNLQWSVSVSNCILNFLIIYTHCYHDMCHLLSSKWHISRDSLAVIGGHWQSFWNFFPLWNQRLECSFDEWASAQDYQVQVRGVRTE